MGKYPCMNTSKSNNASDLKSLQSEFKIGSENQNPPTNDGKVGTSMADRLYGEGPTANTPHRQLRPMKSYPL